LTEIIIYGTRKLISHINARIFTVLGGLGCTYTGQQLLRTYSEYSKLTCKKRVLQFIIYPPVYGRGHGAGGHGAGGGGLRATSAPLYRTRACFKRDESQATAKDSAPLFDLWYIHTVFPSQSKFCRFAIGRGQYDSIL
jgi:hypothetical protein